MEKREISIISGLQDRCNIPFQDLVSVLAGLRPCMRTRLAVKDREQAAAGLGSLGLHMEAYHYGDFGCQIALIGKDPGLLREGIRLDLAGGGLEIQKEIGKILGYPGCCVDAFCGKTAGKPDHVLRALKNSAKVSFFLNFIYNFDSRITDPKVYKRLAAANYSHNDIYLVSHVPCGFGCEASLAYAKRLYLLLSRFFPHKAWEFQDSLRKVFLYKDYCRFAVLDGHCANGRAAYGGLLKINNLFDPGDLALLARGNALRPEAGGRIAVLNGDRAVARLKYKYRLIDFSGPGQGAGPKP